MPRARLREMLLWSVLLAAVISLCAAAYFTNGFNAVFAGPNPAMLMGLIGFAAVLFALLLHRYRLLQNRLATANRIIENSTAFLYRLNSSPDMPLLFLSGNFGKLGYEPQEFLSAPEFYRNLIHPDDLGQLDKARQELLDGGHPKPVQFRLRTRDGAYRWFENRVTHIQGEPETVRSADGIIVDIHDRKQMEEQLRFANLLLTTQMETLPDGVVVTDRDGKVLSWNQRFMSMWDIPEELVQHCFDEKLLRAGARAFKEPESFLARVIFLRNHPEQISYDVLETADGRFVERYTAGLFDAQSGYHGRLWCFRDITAQKQAEAEIRQAASYDALTGLVNRKVFAEAVQREMGRVQRGEKSFAVIFLDLDHFKDVNDTLGHAAGDKLLCAVADRLRHNIRGSDMAARFGGDEFAVLATAIGEPSAAADLAEALRRALEEPYLIQGNHIRSGVTIGIAMHETGEASAERLLSHADVALYRAKSEGRGICRFFTEAMDKEVRLRVTMTSELREAITDNQLFLVYQPQVDIHGEQIVGVEALVRWRHPDRGIVPPGEYIPLAEKSGLIGDLGRWVLQEACRQGKAWIDAGVRPIPIAVNVSSEQFKMVPDLGKEITAILDSCGLPPELIEIELTETGLLEASRDHGRVIANLRNAGIRFAIDDFGTGYSSLDYLRRYPADRIKIAQEFVQHIAEDSGSAIIVKAIIGLARELGMVAIAEGVETAEQHMLLRAWGCRQVQGFYFCRPVLPEELLPSLSSGEIRQKVPCLPPEPARRLKQ